MNICLVHEEYPEETNFGGIATYQRNLAKGLMKLGHNIYIIARSYEKNKYYVENGITVFRLFQEPLEDKVLEYKSYRRQVYLKIKELENIIDIIESPEWGAEVIDYLRDSSRKIPIVIKLHTPLKIWMEYNKCSLGPELTQIMISWERELIIKADKVISCTEILKKQVMEKMYIKKENIEIVPNPANLEDFYVIKDNPKKYILFCGSLEMRKGVDVLARAIPKVLNKIPDIQWVFVGKDTNRNDKNISMIKYIKEIIPEKYHGNIHFLGQIQNSRLNLIYSYAQIAVFPSAFDNFPYVVLEAMASGVPIIGSEHSGMKEMLDNGNCGVLCDCRNDAILADKIISLLKDCQLQKRLIENSLLRINERYSDISVAKKNYSVYQKTIENFKKSY